jgi:hypothetical protein
VFGSPQLKIRHLSSTTYGFQPHFASFGSRLALYRGESAQERSLHGSLEAPGIQEGVDKQNENSESIFIPTSLRSCCAGLGRGNSGLGAANPAVRYDFAAGSDGRYGFPEHAFFGCAAALPDV